MRIAALLAATAAFFASAATPDPWTSPLPSQFMGTPFVAATFTEVSLPARSQALAKLEASPFEPVEASASPSPVPPGFQCPIGTKPYLVRALQWNPTVSGYAVGTGDGILSVKHLSLGGSASVQRAALVVCLDSAPRQVFVEAYGAQ